MTKAKKFYGMFNESVLFEQLLKDEPAQIAQIVGNSLKNFNEPLFNIWSNVTISIFEDIEPFCIYVYLQDFVDSGKTKTEFSTIQFLNLKTPTENGVYDIILRITKNSSLSEKKEWLSISLCYIKNAHTSIRNLQYMYEANILKEAHL